LNHTHSILQRRWGSNHRITGTYFTQLLTILLISTRTEIFARKVGCWLGNRNRNRLLTEMLVFRNDECWHPKIGSRLMVTAVTHTNETCRNLFEQEN